MRLYQCFIAICVCFVCVYVVSVCVCVLSVLCVCVVYMCASCKHYIYAKYCTKSIFTNEDFGFRLDTLTD